MGTPRTRSSRVFTISFPEPLAQQVEEIAREENQNISELFRQAFRAYKVLAMERRLESLRPPTSLNDPVVTEDDIQAFVDEVREEMYRERNNTP